jgi:hypothetical protein
MGTLVTLALVIGLLVGGGGAAAYAHRKVCPINRCMK